MFALLTVGDTVQVWLILIHSKEAPANGMAGPFSFASQNAIAVQERVLYIVWCESRAVCDQTMGSVRLVRYDLLPT